MSGAQNGQLWRWYEMLELEYASSSCDSNPCVILMAFQAAWIKTERAYYLRLVLRAKRCPETLT